MRLIGVAVVLTLGLILAPLAAEAQLAGKVPRVAYLTPWSDSDPGRQRGLEAFRQGLRELGYVEGQNIAIESRSAEGTDDRLPALAADLVRSKVDVIVQRLEQRPRPPSKRPGRFRSSCHSSMIPWEADSSPALRAPEATSRG